MKKISLLLAGMFLFNLSVEAQLLKKIGEKVKRKVEDRTSDEAAEETDEALDEIFERKKKKKRKEKRGQQDNSGQNGNQNDTYANDGVAVSSAKDFVPGSGLIAMDNFAGDAIGDFPVNWNTNSGGEIVTVNGRPGKWLYLNPKGSYTPDKFTRLPENFTFEFDLVYSNDFSFYSDWLNVNFVEMPNRSTDFTKWTRFKYGKNGVRLWLHPQAAGMGNQGRTKIETFVNGSKMVDNKKETNAITNALTVVHVAIWRQKTRLRVYLNDVKVWDIPRAFDTANYNGIVFSRDNPRNDSDQYYISNLRLAEAGADTRHKLLETGRFATNEILFDVNQATIKSVSYSVLNELGKVLQDNPNTKVKIIGHTDSDGDDNANMQLSLDRARSVKAYLSNHFPIAGMRMQTEGKGESQPIADNDSEAGKAQNRRVEFVIIN